MVNVAAAIALLLASPVQAPRDRAAFCKAIEDLHGSVTRDELRQKLGPPDDVWKDGDPASMLGPCDEIWCYGSSGHLTCPTLGKFLLGDDGTFFFVGATGPLPRQELWKEGDLRKYLRSLWRLTGDDEAPADPLRLIQANNLLGPLGRQKALALLHEYGRVCSDEENDWFNELQNLLFKDPDHPESRVSQVQGIPLVNSGWNSGLAFLLFYGDEEHESSLVFDYHTIRPPDDPFVVLAEKGEHPSLRDVLTLVRTAYYRPEIYRWGWDPVPEAEKCHQEFLALGGHWDQTKQMYVRGDGVSLSPDPPLYPLRIWRARNAGQFKVKLRAARHADQDVSFQLAVDGPHGVGFRKGTCRVIDAKSEKALKAENIEPPNLKQIDKEWQCGSGFYCRGIASHERVRFEVIIDGHVSLSPPIDFDWDSSPQLPPRSSATNPT